MSKSVVINVDQKKVFADVNEALIEAGYSHIGTTTGKTSVKPAYELDGTRFTIQKSLIERYKVITLILKTFEGQTDQEKEPAEPEAEN